MSDTKIETGWVIEFGKTPFYIAVLCGDIKETPDANKALRFARKIDANNAIVALGLKTSHSSYHEFVV
jgi:hypothetical protein